jgi:GMP synthase-like glutamine amidotransferase
MNVHVLQHAPFEGIGNMASWLEAHGASVQRTDFLAEPHLPGLTGLDLVIAMGGPMSVHDEAQFTWLGAEKIFLRQAVKSGVSVLGVCLGAQLIAQVLGARVYRNPVREIGWFPVDALEVGEGSFRFPQRFPAFHWHAETFDLPAGAVHLARSNACQNQAFQFGRRVMALQFHLEVTSVGVQEMVDHDGSESAEGGPFVQTPRAICAPIPGSYTNIEVLMHQVLDYLMSARAPG